MKTNTNFWIEKEGCYRGLKYTVKACSRGYRCGYVNVPLELQGVDPEILDGLRVHGGVTFNQEGVIGFDCHHSWDALDMDIMGELEKQTHRECYDSYLFPEARVRYCEYVEQECKGLIDQLLETVGGRRGIERESKI